MSSKPVVAMAISRAMHDVMFTADDLNRLRGAATVVGPADTGLADHLRPLLKDAVVAITGWQTAKFDADLLDHAPKLKLIAHSAGTVKTTPAATDSPADPIVWTMLFSRMVDPPSRFRTEMASTAIGIEALTVSPARSPR